MEEKDVRKIVDNIEDKDVLRLMKKRKKGLLQLLFSRVGLIVLIFIVQFVGLFVLNNMLLNSSWTVTIFEMLFSFLMIFSLFNSDMDSTAKLTWFYLISVSSVPATALLWYTEKDPGHRKIRRRLSGLIEESREKISQDEETIHKPEIIDSATDDLSFYLNHSGNFPVYEHTKVDFFPLGEYKYVRMIEELKKAEKFIFMEYFIIDEGYMWGSILKILADKAAQGVEVRVMYDGMCEVSNLPYDYPKRLETLGIKCKPFLPLTPFFSTRYNYRDHRKILVIDGKVAFNGGVNLADEYINKIDRFGHWKDTAVMLRGQAVQSFTLMFLQMWNLTEKGTLEWDKYLTPYPVESDGFVMPYCDCPLDDYKAGENVYIDILNRAKSYVHIMTPYLILDNELEGALKFAAQRGVDVRIILPGIPDKKSAYALAKSHYKSLVKAGVKLYEYTPGFVHAKVFVSDDEKAVIGTINLDYRSLYHHFECATYMYRCSCIKNIAEDYEKTLEKCSEVTFATIKNTKLSYKIRGSILKVFAPLM